ncbi:leucine-rich repeat protein [Tanacetum coccineum]
MHHLRSPLPTTTKSCTDIERQALLALRDSGSEGKMDCCKWGGVSCNNHGSIPDCLGDMTSLRYLDLSFNQLGGPIPKSFGNYSSLIELHLQSNMLNGPVTNFVGCSSMEILSLGSNNLHGGFLISRDVNP